MTDPAEHIPFNRPFTIGRELEFIALAVRSGHISANGFFSRKCEELFEKEYGVKKAFLTTSCTDALEMAALLLNIGSGDEVIIPSFSFVSTANPFVLRGAKVIFADSCSDHPNMDTEKLELLISERTRAIVCVHYAGMACDMEALTQICSKHNIALVEDAAHAIASRWNGQKQLGTFGPISAFSFHETKNVMAGEGGMLCVNDATLIGRAEMISEKGTNRASFLKGEIGKYEWVDVGSSFLASELTAAYLFGQLEQLDKIQVNRLASWNQYREELTPLVESGLLELPAIPDYAMTNGHIFYVVCRSLNQRAELIEKLRSESIQAVFHYQSLHKSPFYARSNPPVDLPNADRFSDCLLRLPLYYGIQQFQISKICSVIRRYFGLSA